MAWQSGLSPRESGEWTWGEPVSYTHLRKTFRYGRRVDKRTMRLID